jgi:hypothetical protein
MATLAPAPLEGRSAGSKPLVERGGGGTDADAAARGGDQGSAPLFAYRHLLQELLAALLGYTGDVFVDAADAAPPGGPPPPLQHPAVCTVRLAGDLSWVEARDRQLLERLAGLAFHFKQLRAFVDAERGAAPRSAYRQALCAGITGAQGWGGVGGEVGGAVGVGRGGVGWGGGEGSARPAGARPWHGARPAGCIRVRHASAPCKRVGALPPPARPQSSSASTRTPCSSCSASCWSSPRRGSRRCSTSCCQCRCARAACVGLRLASAPRQCAF